MPAPVKWSAADFELIDPQDPHGEPWLAAAPGGHFTLSYFETFDNPPVHTDIEARLYSAAGVDTGFVNVTVSASWTEHQPASAYLPDGRQVVVWTERPNGAGGLSLVHAAVYVADTLVSISDFFVNGGAGPEFDPVVAAGRNGFAIALADESVVGGRLILKFYNLAGNLVNTLFAPDAPETVDNPAGGEGDYRDAEMTALANGNYAIAWTDADNDIWARVFSSDGTAIGGFIDVEPGGSPAGFPDVTPLADGRLLITYNQFTAFTVRGRIFEADGTPSSGSFTIAANAINTVFQQVQSAALRDGRFVTVWVNFAGNIEGQVMKADGSPDGAAFAVNGDAAGDKGRPVIATLADGRFVVSWESGAGATQTIFSTIFDPRETGLKAGASSFDDDWVGTSFADAVYMGAGDDSFAGGAGNDTVFGEAHADILFGEAGSDKLYGGNDGDSLDGGTENDTLNGELGDDALYGAIGSDTLNGGDGKDLLYGGTEADILNGNNGNDTLDGGIGLDVLNGGNGDDALDGGADKDTLNGDANNDTLFGGDGGDTLRGGTGNDRHLGGTGGDVHLGGAGLDTFVFTATNQGNDRIDDWGAADDQIEIDASAFGGGLAAGALAANRLVVGAAPVANQAFGQFLYNTANGQLTWDADGTGAGAAVAITRLLNSGVAVGTLTVADFDIVA